MKSRMITLEETIGGNWEKMKYVSMLSDTYAHFVFLTMTQQSI